MSARTTARRATSYDIARVAGVAQSTVSRCFQPGSNISPATRALVTSVAERLGYMPNAVARSLITQRSNLVGVVATHYTLRSNPDVMHAIGETLAAAGKQFLLVTAQNDATTIADLRGALEYPLDGLISCVSLVDATLIELQARGVPLVLFNRHSPRIAVDSVITNHAAAASIVATALYQAGHRDFLCVCGPRNAHVSRNRRAGFLRRLSELGIANTPVIETDYSYDGGRRGLLDYLSNAARPGAVFCANDQIALGVMDACRFDLHLSIPEDISVIGFDDVAEAARPSYDLTTMHQDSVMMARTAVDILLRRIASPGSNGTINTVVDAAFIRRGSARLTALSCTSSCR